MRSACSLSHCLHCYRCARNVCRECSVRNGDSGTVKRRQGATVALRRPAGQCSAGLQHSSCLAKNVRNEVPSQLHSFSGSYIHCTCCSSVNGQLIRDVTTVSHSNSTTTSTVIVILVMVWGHKHSPGEALFHLIQCMWSKVSYLYTCRIKELVTD